LPELKDRLQVALGPGRLGELYEQKGNREEALEDYGKLAELWKDAHPDLQPPGSDLKQRMVHLAGEGGPP